MPKPLPVVAILYLLAIPMALGAAAQSPNSDFNPSCGLLGKFVRYKQHYQHCKSGVICNDRGVCRRKPTNWAAPEAIQESPETNAISESNHSLTASAGIAADAVVAGASAGAAATAGASAGAGGASAGGSGQGGASTAGGGISAAGGGGLGVGGL